VSQNIERPSITSYHPSTLDKMIGWLLSPAVRGILIAGIVLGLYFEIQTPGLGIPSLAAICAAILYFAPAYLDGLAENWEIVLFAVGILLILLEVFIIPGFGIAGVSGIIISVGSLVLAMLRNVSFDFSLVGFESAFLTLAILFIVSVAFILTLLFLPKKSKSHLFSKFVLETTLEEARINTPIQASVKVGQTGEVVFECKPEGKVKVEGQLYIALSRSEVISVGTKVVIISFNGQKLIVEQID